MTVPDTKAAASLQGDWHIYMVQCADGSLYTGIARNLAARITVHNNGKGARYTRSRLPVKLVYSESASDRAAASRREAALKRLSREQKLAIIQTGPARQPL